MKKNKSTKYQYFNREPVKTIAQIKAEFSELVTTRQTMTEDKLEELMILLFSIPLDKS